MMAEQLLELRSIAWRTRSFALSDIDVRIGQSDYACLIGPTGSGKTLLLEVIAGLRAPCRGRIRYRGLDVTEAPPEARFMGFAYQDSLLYPFLSVRDNIFFGAKVQKRYKDPGVRSRYRELLDILGIGHLVDRSPLYLSGGERQRVSLARALLLSPPLLLLDEPLSALDTQRRLGLRDMLKDIHRRDGVAVLHVTHDLSEAESLATKLVVLRDGRIVQQGDTRAVMARPADEWATNFLGSDCAPAPSANALPGRPSGRASPGDTP
jgi:ABC-type sugar transport system ATPase subunit